MDVLFELDPDRIDVVRPIGTEIGVVTIETRPVVLVPLLYVLVPLMEVGDAGGTVEVVLQGLGRPLVSILDQVTVWVVFCI